MTIDGLWGGYLRKQNKVLDRNLSEFRGKAIGVDAGMVLHGTYHSAGVARTFHQFPLVPLESSFEYALERVRIAFSKHVIKAVIVCDGLSNPLKKEEDDRRGNERDESLAQLRTLYTTTTNPTADDLATALKLSKDSCRTTSRVIAQLKSWADLHPSSVIVVGSFSEADQQLASMCMKSPTYLSCLGFSATGEYLPAPKSCCSCPAGNLFCSHMLAHFLLLLVYQLERTWDMNVVTGAMPAPVKSIDVPISLEFALTQMGSQFAPAPRAKEAAVGEEKEEGKADEEDEEDEVAFVREDMMADRQGGGDVKVIDVCTRVQSYLEKSKQRGRARSAIARSALQLEDVVATNNALLARGTQLGDILRQAERMQRIQLLTAGGHISPDLQISGYVNYFKDRDEGVVVLAGKMIATEIPAEVLSAAKK
jgi:XPG N-terminal domain